MRLNKDVRPRAAVDGLVSYLRVRGSCPLGRDDPSNTVGLLRVFTVTSLSKYWILIIKVAILDVNLSRNTFGFRLLRVIKSEDETHELIFSLAETRRSPAKPAANWRCPRWGITLEECTAISLNRITPDLRREGEIISMLLSYIWSTAESLIKSRSNQCSSSDGHFPCPWNPRSVQKRYHWQKESLQIHHLGEWD